jgi:hypothetical protein
MSIDRPPEIYPECRVGASLEETAVHSLHGCWRELYLWAWQAYDLTDWSWRRAGFFDACNEAKPFAKVVNAAFLINYALSDNRAAQWHSTEDYSSSTTAAENRFHSSIWCSLDSTETIKPASSQKSYFFSNRLWFHCPSFNPGSNSDSPSFRAAVLVHESWHHWQYKHGFVSAHPKCNSPITGNEQDCDYYYFHRVGAFEFGQMERYSTNPNNFQFHSPYQIEVEFDADLAEFSHPWVPVSVKQAARNSGNGRITEGRFINAVGYTIGSPRPF